MQDDFEQALQGALQVLKKTSGSRPSVPRVEERGVVASSGSGVAKVHGIAGVKMGELVRFSDGSLGTAFSLHEDYVDVLLFDEEASVKPGREVLRTGNVLEAPVGECLLGRIVDPLGRPRDGKDTPDCGQVLPAERKAPAIMDRLPVNVPVQTGIQVIDALIPIGRGQRELILGDRETGKTSIAVDTIINQRDNGMICVYCAIGKRSSAVAKVVSDLKEHEALGSTIVVSVTEDEPPGLNYLAPYTATAMAEYFVDRGEDVLIVYDDLTRHARSYRELSLLLRRPPAREAFPGDIFYIHSRLLERSTRLNEDLGGGSLTALPIVETQSENISAYIPTNLISITDGQIYLSPRLFQKGMLPAVDVGRSVSRVGGKTQLPAYKTVTGDLRLTYSQFEELENFSRFGVRLDEDTQATLERGKRIREVLKQYEHDLLTVPEQILILISLNGGLFDDIPLDRVRETIRSLRSSLDQSPLDTMERVMEGIELEDEDISNIRTSASEWIEESKSKEDDPEDNGETPDNKTED